jgi:hypothetical protein
MRYLLDSNIFIQAHRFHYPFDVFPVFWNWLEMENEKGSIGSIDGVFDEIKAGDDELSDWIKGVDIETWFLKCDDEETQQCYAEIVNQIMRNIQYKTTAKEEFLRVADPWLIAKAKSEKLTVVTQETSDPQSRKKIFIPDICKEHNISHINTIGLIRALSGRF